MPPKETMNSFQRVMAALAFRQPDRVPLFLFVTMHGAKELGISIREYFSKPEYVVEGQLRLRAKYRNDCLYPFFYAAVEVEAFGAEVIYVEDGPPNSGLPFIRSKEDILKLMPPDVQSSPCLVKVLKTEEMLKKRVTQEVPILGVVMSPFSLPVMQMGFERYLDLIFEGGKYFDRLMRINEEFCVQWANAQLRAGATAICYYDPVSSATIISRELYLRTGFEIAKRTIARIHGPTATHFASGSCLPFLDVIAKTGTKMIGVSINEDMGAIKERSRHQLAVLGNLNGIEMRRWTAEQAELEVKKAIAMAGPGSGFILADNHGEIPFQVPHEVLNAISDAVQKWGSYPLDWVRGEPSRGKIVA